MLILITLLTKLPEIEENEDPATTTRLQDALRISHLRNGMLAELCYMAAEVGIVSFIIRYTKFLQLVGVTEQGAAGYISAFMICVLIGRIFGGYILTRFRPNNVLALLSIITMGLLIGAILLNSEAAIWCLVLIGLSTAMVFPIVFTLSIKDLGPYTKQGSSLMFMCVVGGAIGPPVMGLISDAATIKVAFLVPILCYVVIFWFARKGSQVR